MQFAVRVVPAAAHEIPIDRLFGGAFEKRAAQVGKLGFADAEIGKAVFHVCLHRHGAFGVGVLLQDGEQGGVVHTFFLFAGDGRVWGRLKSWSLFCFPFAALVF